MTSQPKSDHDAGKYISATQFAYLHNAYRWSRIKTGYLHI